MSYPAQLWENFLYSNIQQHICQLRAKRIQALTKWRIPEKCQVNELNSFPDDIFWVTVPVYWELAAGVHRKEDTLLHTWPPLLCIFPECLQITTYYGQNTWINKSFCQFSYLEYSSSFPRMSFLPWCVCLDRSERGWLLSQKTASGEKQMQWCYLSWEPFTFVFLSCHRWESESIQTVEVQYIFSVNMLVLTVPLRSVMRETSRCSSTTWLSLYWR